ncbi:hypothetical protein GA0070607_4733 [Micromonospora coriariae]|uniref:Uncharacterized protein n=1 Tax=Micromonospora coriariae TaxID=285665 RepID=A0A1C4X653_9ACTN|nr:hypothetical protein GA0070607_4733 [Micromonospora coriariae]
MTVTRCEAVRCGAYQAPNGHGPVVAEALVGPCPQAQQRAGCRTTSVLTVLPDRTVTLFVRLLNPSLE